MSRLLLLLVGVAALTTPSHAQNDCGLPVTTTQPRTRRQAAPSSTTTSPPTNTAPATPELYSSCGAVVVSDRFLLTAAYCVLNPSKPVNSVILGDLDLSQDNEPNSRPANYDIELIIIHPNFTHHPETGIRYNDLALLKTKTKIEFNEAVFPHCLSRRRPAIGSLVTASGYGAVNETHTASHLQEGELTVMSLSECEAEYRAKGKEALLKGAYPNLLQGYGVVCAGHPIRGVCNGDEGGPLIRKDASDRSFLEGIISFAGDICGPGVLPSLSTSIADHYDFILETIQNV